MVHDPERVIPERLDFDRFPGSQGDGLVPHLGVHPRERGAGLPRVDEAVQVHADMKTRPVLIMLDNIFHRRPEMIFDERKILGVADVVKRRDDIPKAGIHRVVFGLAGGVRKAVRDNPVTGIGGISFKNLSRLRDAPRDEEKSGQRNERVAPPILEPVIAGDQTFLLALALAGAVFHEELIGGENQMMRHVIGRLPAGKKRLAPLALGV